MMGGRASGSAGNAELLKRKKKRRTRKHTLCDSGSCAIRVRRERGLQVRRQVAMAVLGFASWVWRFD